MELVRALAVLAEPPRHETERVAALLGLEGTPTPADYTEIFLLQLCPYASVYLGAEGMLGGEARDRVAGFWRALDQVPPTEPDHLAALLALYAKLAELEASEIESERIDALGRARAALLWEHLLTWVPTYLMKLSDIATPCYSAWSHLLVQALTVEAKKHPMQAEPLHLREAPEILDRDEDWDRIADNLLAPIRSGIILTRNDLARGAQTLDLGRRTGQRKLILDSLFSQDPSGVTRWLRMEAATWAEKHAAQSTVLGTVSDFWAERARATVQLLTDESTAADMAPRRSAGHHFAS